MIKTTYTIGRKEKPNYILTIAKDNPQNSTDDLDEYLARYFSRHGGMYWSVEHE